MIKPVKDYVLVNKTTISQSDGGVYLPEDAFGYSQIFEGTVEAIGPLCVLSLEKGSSIIFKTADAIEVEKDKFIVEEKDIIGFVS